MSIFLPFFNLRKILYPIQGICTNLWLCIELWVLGSKKHRIATMFFVVHILFLILINWNFLKHFYLIYLQNVFYPFQGYFYYIFCFRGIRFYNMIYRIIIFWSFLSYNQNRYLHSFKLFTITGNGKSTIYFSIFMALTMIISGISLLK